MACNGHRNSSLSKTAFLTLATSFEKSVLNPKIWADLCHDPITSLLDMSTGLLAGAHYNLDSGEKPVSGVTRRTHGRKQLLMNHDRRSRWLTNGAGVSIVDMKRLEMRVAEL